MKKFEHLHGKCAGFCAVMSFFFISFGQAGSGHFDHISIEQGLSQSSVFSILQDSKGFMWFGTLDGLNKYDGYMFTVYKSDPRDPKTLSNNTIVKIFEDTHGRLWIGTLGGGLNRFDPRTETFTRYRHDPANSASLSNDNVRSIFQDALGRLWIGTNNGLNLYEPGTDRFVRYQHNQASANSLSNNVVWSIYESPSEPGILWIGTYDGLNRYDAARNAFSVYKHDPGDRTSISNNYIWTIIESDSGHLWVGSNNGLNLFDKRRGTCERFTHDARDKRSIGGNNVWALCRDKAGTVYAGTLDGGLSKIIRSESAPQWSFVNFRHDPSDPGSLSHDFVWSMHEDRTGILWLGTDVGINKLDPNAAKFLHYRSEPFDPKSLSNNEVTAIFRDHLGILWVGTRSGLNQFDERNSRFIHYKHSPGDRYSISSNYIRSINEDRSGGLWIGTNGGGLNKFNRSRKTFANADNGGIPDGITSKDITYIHEDTDGTLWIGTLAGLFTYAPPTGTVSSYTKDPDDPLSLSHDYVYTIHESRDGSLWIGTLGGGLNKFDRATRSFIHFTENPADTSSISNNNVWCIHENAAGDMWIGTNNGLDRFDRKTGTFTHFDEKNGLVNNVIYGILEDDRQNLWISSNKGLSCFNPASGAVKNYTSNDGLQSDQFGGNDHFKDARGYMYFGGINGFNMFYPDSIRDNPHVPPIVFTDFQIFNRSAGIGGDSPLTQAISGTRSVTLSYSQNVFSIEFAALHFSSPQSNTYAYKMEGFDKEWISAGTRRFVTYTNLDPGTYVFKVMGSNNDGVWNTDGTSLEIVILPPFWKRWWFITAVVVFILSIIATIVFIQFRHLLAIERLRVKIASDLHDDIGTRLTEISLLSDMVYHVETNDLRTIKESVRNIGGIARALIENMSDIVWLINPKRDSLFELFIKLKDGYEEILSYRQILLYINNFSSMEKVFLTMEYRKNVYLIFKEAINNSIKHSACTEISINTELAGSILTITMYDNGKGFDVNNRRSGNGLENMQRRAEAIGGTLRIQSSAASGTMIKFTGKI